MSKPKILIIATPGLTTELLYSGLNDFGNIHQIVLEQAESKTAVIKRRFKKPGVWKTIGQVLFMSLVQPFIPARKDRIAEIIKTSGLNATALPNDKIKSIQSVHDPELIELIKTEKPDLICINGTRILKHNLLESITCPVINIHVGITPKYRGVHGGYWALYNNEPNLFGVTLHYVDKGIDTGTIIAQEVIETTEKDNYNTYPVLQYVNGVKLIQTHLTSIIDGSVSGVDALTKESRLHYHPTLWQYLSNKTK